MNSKYMKNPLDTLSEKRILVDNLIKNLENYMTLEVKNKKINLVKQVTALETLSPLKTLIRGYAIVENEEGKMIKSAKQLKLDDEIKITLNDGKIKAKVIQENTL